MKLRILLFSAISIFLLTKSAYSQTAYVELISGSSLSGNTINVDFEGGTFYFKVPETYRQPDYISTSLPALTEVSFLKYEVNNGVRYYVYKIKTNRLSEPGYYSVGYSGFVKAIRSDGSEDSFNVLISGNQLVLTNAASYEEITYLHSGGKWLTPNSIISVFMLQDVKVFGTMSGGSLPTQIGSYNLTFILENGLEIKAPLFYLSSTQINALVPTPINGYVRIEFRDGNKKLAEARDIIGNLFPVGPYFPALFTANFTGTGVPVMQIVRRDKQGKVTVSEPAYNADRNDTEPIKVNNPDEEVWFVLYGTGLRNWPQQDVYVEGYNNLFSVEYVGETPGLFGLDQVNLKVSPSLAGSGQIPFRLLGNLPNYAFTQSLKIRIK